MSDIVSGLPKCQAGLPGQWKNDKKQMRTTSYAERIQI